MGRKAIGQRKRWVSEMSSQNNILFFPMVARPCILEVLTEFLDAQARRLKPRTYRRYEEVVDLFRHCLNNYGVEELTNSTDLIFYERLYLRKNLEFTATFGADKILPSLPYFLNFFMLRKVMASEELLEAAGTVSKRLVRWLEERGYVGSEEAKEAAKVVTEAARELPAAERVARLLFHYAQSHAPRYWTSELDDYFTIDKVDPGVLVLAGSNTAALVELKVPREITDQCKEGWQVSLLLGKTQGGWSILETGNVYPS